MGYFICTEYSFMSSFLPVILNRYFSKLTLALVIPESAGKQVTHPASLETLNPERTGIYKHVVLHGATLSHSKQNKLAAFLRTLRNNPGSVLLPQHHSLLSSLPFHSAPELLALPVALPSFTNHHLQLAPSLQTRQTINYCLPAAGFQLPEASTPPSSANSKLKSASTKRWAN